MFTLFLYLEEHAVTLARVAAHRKLEVLSCLAADGTVKGTGNNFEDQTPFFNVIIHCRKVILSRSYMDNRTLK